MSTDSPTAPAARVSARQLTRRRRTAAWKRGWAQFRALGACALDLCLLLLFGCLPPAVLNFMVAEQFRQEPAKVASIVLIGNVLSIVFVPLGLALALH